MATITPITIRIRRALNGHSLHELAKETDLSMPTLYAYRNGTRRPSPDSWRKLAAALGLTYDEVQAGLMDLVAPTGS